MYIVIKHSKEIFEGSISFADSIDNFSKRIFYKSIEATGLVLGIFEKYEDFNNFLESLPIGEYSYFQSYGNESKAIVSNKIEVKLV